MDSITKLDSTTKVISRSLHEGVYQSVDVLNRNGHPDWNNSLVYLIYKFNITNYLY